MLLVDLVMNYLAPVGFGQLFLLFFKLLFQIGNCPVFQPCGGLQVAFALCILEFRLCILDLLLELFYLVDVAFFIFPLSREFLVLFL